MTKYKTQRQRIFKQQFLGAAISNYEYQTTNLFR